MKFPGDDGFHAELKLRVQAYFRDNDLSPHGDARMVLKTALILAWFGVSYAALVFAATTWWQAVPAALSLVLSVAGIGFAIQHDANHGAYSSRQSVNRVLGITLDLLGASSYFWHWKHNVLHHTYPNVQGADPDLNAEPFARLSPDQARRRLHRVQQFYMWALYGFLYLKWHLVDDFQNLAQGRIAENRVPRPSRLRTLEMFAGKAAFFGWALVVPMLFHRWWVVLAFYGAASSLLGIVLAVVFQLAHCTEAAGFPRPAPGSDKVDDGWAAHQVHTTVDFARGNPVLTWYLGGLNFQVEHHLFPKVCHIHYPRLARIVEEGCRDYGVRYAAYDGVLEAVSSHWRWLGRMGGA